MSKEYFKVFHSYLKSIEPLNDAERGRLFTAMLEYSITGVEPKLNGNERFIFPTMKANLDREVESYRNTVEANRLNGRKGGRPSKPKESEKSHSVFEKPKESEKSQDKDKDKDNTPPISPSKRGMERFVPPTVDEVREYCQARGNGIDPETFVAFYASKGWMVGKNHMKDWKQAVITWEKSRKPVEQQKPKQPDGPAYRKEVDPETGEEVIVWLK